jgi:hypothetical protein
LIARVLLDALGLAGDLGDVALLLGALRTPAGAETDATTIAREAGTDAGAPIVEIVASLVPAGATSEAMVETEPEGTEDTPDAGASATADRVAVTPGIGAPSPCETDVE